MKALSLSFSLASRVVKNASVPTAPSSDDAMRSVKLPCTLLLSHRSRSACDVALV